MLPQIPAAKVLRNSRRSGCSRRSNTAVEDSSNLAGDPVGGHAQRLIDVNITLRHPAPGVAQQGRDGEFGEA